jgi:hypothetical protein
MVRTCCWRSPSAGLRPPPQLTSDWNFLNLFANTNHRFIASMR